MYEASEIVAVGAAHELILGQKFVADHVDQEGTSQRDERFMDIDETDV